MATPSPVRFLLLAAALVAVRPAAAATYHVSASIGNDDWSGTVPEPRGDDGPWKTLRKASRAYEPGDTILLRRGDRWNEELRPLGEGAPERPILIRGYGEGPKPVIDRQDDRQDRSGIRLADQGGFRIEGLEFARCMTGIYADYSRGCPTKRSLWIEDCVFRDSLLYQHYEDYPKRKIGLGVCLFSHETADRVVLADVTVRNCVFKRLASGFWTNSPDNFNKNASFVYNFANLVFEDCLFEEGYQWQLGIRGVDGGAVRRCVTHDIGRGFRSFNGVAGGMFFRCRNWVFEDSEWGFIDIGLGSGDGEAFDFEGNCNDMTMRNCLFHDTDGPCFLLCCYASDGNPNRGTVMERCVLNGRAKRPIGLPRCEIVNTTDWNETTWKDCRFYLSHGEFLMRTMDPEKDKRAAFEGCFIKDLARACESPRLPGRSTTSSENGETIVELDFGAARQVTEFLVSEADGSRVERWAIEAWDERSGRWVGCFNGRTIGTDFVAPVVARTTPRVRLRLLRTAEGDPKIAAFDAFDDRLGDPFTMPRGQEPPPRQGR